MVAVRMTAVLTAVAAVLALLLGWSARGWLADAQLERERAAHAQQLADAVVSAEAEARRWRDAARRAESRAVKAQRAVSAAREDLKQEASRVEAATGARCDLGAEWVRIYDRALQAGDPAGAARPASGGADGGAVPAASADEWQVMRVHVDNAASWSECRARLSALQDWARNVSDGGNQGD